VSLRRCPECAISTDVGTSATHNLLYSAGSNSTEVSISLSTLAPSLRQATSSCRFPAEKASDRTRWQPVDYEILQSLQEYLDLLYKGSGGEVSGMGDAWTEGQAVCSILGALVPVVRDLKYVQ
jgi:hypothetical protein